MKPLSTRRTALLAALAAALAAPAAEAQGIAAPALPLALNSITEAAPLLSEPGTEGSALERGRYAVVIDLDQNRLFFKQGDLTLWSAPVGTGTGLRLKDDDREWKFSTPNGTFHVQYKERDPAWIAPDWYFVENGLPLPPQGDSARIFPGGLGAAALFIEHDLAIHGTNRPDLLGQRVSHGCIRMSNRDALRLFHNVQVGTEVVIVGGRDLPERVVTPEQVMAEKAKQTFDPTRRGPAADPVVEEWKALDTADLVRVLRNELWIDEESSRWPEVAALLLGRGLEREDDAALHGLMAQVGRLPDRRLEREYATFLADAYGRGALRTLTALASFDSRRRDVVAAAIVDATMHLYHGAFDDPTAPWPTARVPRSIVEEESEQGWDLIAAAERTFRLN